MTPCFYRVHLLRLNLSSRSLFVSFYSSPFLQHHFTIPTVGSLHPLHSLVLPPGSFLLPRPLPSSLACHLNDRCRYVCNRQTAVNLAAAGPGRVVRSDHQYGRRDDP
eukprot:767573-Hanusia_phi.AAC.2